MIGWFFLCQLLVGNLFGKAISLNFGSTSGGISTGLEYETPIDSNNQLGGFFHLTPKKETLGVKSLGGFIRQKIKRGRFRVIITPGLGLHILDVPGHESSSAIGPIMGIGVLFNISPSMAIGLDNLRMWSWSAKPYGQPIGGYDLALVKFYIVY